MTVALIPLLFQGGASTAQSGTTFDSPFPTPPAPPVPTPSPPSAEAQKALRYISEREGIPVEGLLIVNDYERSFALTGRTFRAVLILDVRTDHGQEYYVPVDLADGRIEDNWNAVEAAERAAYRAKYGKFHPSLYERLQEVGDDDLLPVAIWMAPSKVRTREEVYAELAARYPEAAQTLEREGTPWAVDDSALAKEIREEYRRMRSADTAARVGSLADHLGGRGFEARTYGAMPSISAFLPKKVIVALAERDDVGLIYLIEEQGSVGTDTAIPTDRVPAVWQRGFDGSGVDIVILEPGNIDDDVDCLDIVATRVSPQGEQGHKTMVASIAACDDDTYKGVAFGARIVDAGFDETGGASQTDAVEALRWAVQDQDADVVNISYVWEYDNNLNWTDLAFDYWAREEGVTIVSATGNSGGSLGSPSKAWNVISVGGSDDDQTSAWSDDGMYANSSYVNPVGDHREKPEVVAPAVSITTIDLGGAVYTATGTSLAAPQVTGLAALLIDRRSSLASWPPAIKVIIMASAVHNIHGPSNIPTGQDLRDGAGSIDAALADEIAKNRSYSSSTPCDDSCWWGINTNSSSPSLGGSLYRYFNASSGERIRVVISWWSNADPPLDHPDLADGELDTNYNLYIYAPNGDLVGYTASNDNNYELAEFIASETGKYKIRVYRSSIGDGNESSNHLGIAWVKDATYLPDLRNKDGWVSEFYVRNDGAEPRNVTIHYFDSDGDPTPKVSDTCSLLPNQRCWIPVNYLNRIPYGTTGSAIVGGSEDVSVVVENIYSGSGRYLAVAYPGETAPATMVYAPYVVKRWPTGHSSWRQSTDLIIQNTGSQQATVTITFYDSWGSSSTLHQETRTIPANGQITLSGIEMPTWEGSLGTMASAVVASTQPVAVVARTYTGVANSSGVIVTPYLAGSYRAFTSGADKVYIPVVGQEYYNYDSSLQVQNLRNGNTTFEIRYYRLGEEDPFLTLNPTVGAYRSMNFWRPADPPDNIYLGSAVVDVISGGPVVAMAQYDHVDNSQNRYGVNQYEGVTAGTRSDVLPHVQGTSPWDWAGIMVQNMGESTTDIATQFYYQSGSPFGSAITKNNVYPESAALYWDTSVPDISGSAVAFASPAMAVNFDRSGSWTNKDCMMGYG